MTTLTTLRITTLSVLFVVLSQLHLAAAGGPVVVIVTPPVSQSVASGADVTFTVDATGAGTLQYEWQHGNTVIPSVTTSSLTITNAQLGDAGVYTVTIIKGSQRIAASPAVLTVDGLSIQDLQGPVLSLSNPSGSYANVYEEQFTFTGKASDDVGLASICYQQDGGPWIPATPGTDWSFGVVLHPGTNEFLLKAVDLIGNNSATQKVVLFRSIIQPLALSIVGDGRVAGATDGQSMEIGRSYTLKAVPAAGNYFRSWIANGEVFTDPILHLVMSSNTTVTANFISNPFLKLTGVYQGLFYDTVSPAHETSGIFSYKLSNRGKFSGKLTMAGESSSFSGQFDMDLQAQLTVARKTHGASIVITLQLALDSDRVTGQVSRGAQTSAVEGYRATFSSTDPTPEFDGNYTIAFPGSADAASSPFGLGFGLVSVSTAGAVKFKGALADGVAATQIMPLAANGQWPLYISLYKGQGSIFGWLTFVDSGNSDVSGLLLWTKPSGAAGTCYPSGFINEVAIKGSRYTAPPSGMSALTFGDASLQLEGGNLAAPTSSEVFLNEFNTVTIVSSETAKLALKLNSSSGLLSGSFVHPQTLKKSTIKGVVLQRQNVGTGFFLGTDQSGSVSFGLPENFPLFAPAP